MHYRCDDEDLGANHFIFMFVMKKVMMMHWLMSQHNFDPNNALSTYYTWHGHNDLDEDKVMMEISVHRSKHDDGISEECIKDISEGIVMMKEWCNKWSPQWCNNDDDIKSKKEEDWCLHLGMAS